MAADREMRVVQVGKSKEQQPLLRRTLPTRVKELSYDSTAPTGRSCVVWAVARRHEAGVSFVDVDVWHSPPCPTGWPTLLGRARGLTRAQHA